jgi:hypothetical protein
MIVHDCEQGSEAWHFARMGIPTASEFFKLLTPTGKPSASAKGIAHRLLAELITGKPITDFDGNAHTERGKELEPDAIAFYEMQNGLDTVRVGFVTDDARTMGCSPDCLVGDDGLLEIKCPAPHTHVEYMLNGLDKGYYPQIQGQLLVTGRKWVDWMSYHPEMEPVIIRVERDEKYLADLSAAITAFTKIMNEGKAKLVKEAA